MVCPQGSQPCLSLVCHWYDVMVQIIILHLFIRFSPFLFPLQQLLLFIFIVQLPRNSKGKEVKRNKKKKKQNEEK